MSEHDAGATAGGAVVRVVRGDPDAMELAALIAGLTAASAGVEDAERAQIRHRWMDRSHALRNGARVPPERGVDSWRWSLHP